MKSRFGRLVDAYRRSIIGESEEAPVDGTEKWLGNYADPFSYLEDSEALLFYDIVGPWAEFISFYKDEPEAGDGISVTADADGKVDCPEISSNEALKDHYYDLPGKEPNGPYSDDDDEVLKRTQKDFMEDFKEVVWTFLDYITYLTVTGKAEDWKTAAQQAFAEAKEMGAKLSPLNYGPINVEVLAIDPDKRSISFKLTVA